MKLSTPTRENHEALWNWLAKNPEKEKWDWPGFKTMLTLGIKHPRTSCFLCEDIHIGCYYNSAPCPLLSCMDRPGLYRKWNDSTDSEERSQLALAIANCFTKEKIKC
jgi:hypothetical protein